MIGRAAHPHPNVVARYRRIRRATGSLHQVGELTAKEHIRRLDPEGLLTMAERVGVERAGKVLEDYLAGCRKLAAPHAAGEGAEALTAERGGFR